MKAKLVKKLKEINLNDHLKVNIDGERITVSDDRLAHCPNEEPTNILPFSVEFAKLLEANKNINKITTPKAGPEVIISFSCSYSDFEELIEGNLFNKIATFLSFIANGLSRFLNFLASFFSPSTSATNKEKKQKSISQPQTKSKISSPIDLIKEGDAAVKMVGTRPDYFRDSLKNPNSEDAKSTSYKDTKRKVDKKGEILNKNLEWEENVNLSKNPNAVKTHTKSTSFSLLRPQGHNRLFNGTADSVGGSNNYDIGLLFDAKRLKPAKHAYYKEDGFTNWRLWWRQDDQGKNVEEHLKDTFERFKKNRLPTYKDLKDYVKNSDSKTSHNELYAHASKEALCALVIRYDAYKKHNREARVWAICEKAKFEEDLGIKGLPILIINAFDDKGQPVEPIEYKIEQQKLDFEEYIKTKGQDPSISVTAYFEDRFGVSYDKMDRYLNSGSTLNI